MDKQIHTQDQYIRAKRSLDARLAESGRGEELRILKESEENRIYRIFGNYEHEKRERRQKATLVAVFLNSIPLEERPQRMQEVFDRLTAIPYSMEEFMTLVIELTQPR